MHKRPKTANLTLTKDFLIDIKSIPNDASPQLVEYCYANSDHRTCLVFLSGLGLDFRDFDDHLCSFGDYDRLGVTTYGFQPGENIHYCLTLDEHAIVIAHVINKVLKSKAYDSIILVGFSIGADLVLKLAQNRQIQRRISKVIALDPNIAPQTLTISSEMAKLKNTKAALQVATYISSSFKAPSLSSWLGIHSYLVRVFTKFNGERLAYLQDFAEQVVAEFDGKGTTEFRKKVTDCLDGADEVRVVLSDNSFHEALMSEFANNNNTRLDVCLERGKEHFDLIQGVSVIEDALQQHNNTVAGGA